MKFSEQWLREWVNPPITTEELSHQLTMVGLEVDAVEPVAPEFSGVVVGKVVNIEPHPEAGKLQICQVDIGQKNPLTIVCGASNVYIGMLAPTACVGAMLPGDFKIKKAKLRGVESQGMLCSAAELGLAESADGLMDLGMDANPGQDVRDYLQLQDVSLELGLTPNRSDCLGIAGIAREVGVLNRCDVETLAINPPNPTIADELSIDVRAAEACPRYIGRIIQGIKPDTQTPMWMQERLRRSGSRSIGPVVDVTNYVLLELGQPMHAFDLEKLSGGITVRYAKNKEALTLLDGQEVILDRDTLVIADHNKAIALAGIMGGEETAVGEDTNSLFLESAFFSPKVIAGKARGYGLHTDSSHRFERGVDPDLPRQAMERATELLLAIVGGQAAPVSEVAFEEYFPKSRPITLRAARIKRLLGMEIPETEVSEILRRLGLEITDTQPGTWQVVAPSFRFDIAIEVDLIEEIARIHDYGKVPTHRPSANLEISSTVQKNRIDQTIRQLLVSRGYQEAITYSFVDPEVQAKLDPDGEARALANPISAETTVMRTCLWSGLVQALHYNINRQQKRVRLFEYGTVFIKEGRKFVEENAVAGIVTGSTVPEQWGEPARKADFYDLKGDVEVIIGKIGHLSAVNYESRDHPALHPGQSACITDHDGQVLGWLGALHPETKKSLDLDQNVLVFELKFNKIKQKGSPVFQAITKFPAVRRDVAITVDEQITSQAVYECIQKAAGGLLQELHIFDVYQGEGIEKGRKSLALGLTLQDFSRTLTDEEIDPLIQSVLEKLKKKTGAILRE